MEIGTKIKDLRIKNGLTQEELAGRCELSKGFISQLERDLTSPSIATLLDILECLGTNIKDFFNQDGQEKIVFGKDDFFERENKTMANLVKWIVPSAQKNAMEPILLLLDKEGRSEPDLPHEGEEFGYILSGTVFIHLGTRRFKAKKGECFYFKPDANHYIENAGLSQAQVLWISTPPTF